MGSPGVGSGVVGVATGDLVVGDGLGTGLGTELGSRAGSGVVGVVMGDLVVGDGLGTGLGAELGTGLGIKLGTGVGSGVIGGGVEVLQTSKVSNMVLARSLQCLPHECTQDLPFRKENCNTFKFVYSRVTGIVREIKFCCSVACVIARSGDTTTTII